MSILILVARCTFLREMRTGTIIRGLESESLLCEGILGLRFQSVTNIYVCMDDFSSSSTSQDMVTTTIGSVNNASQYTKRKRDFLQIGRRH
jgi:hypothetical protein